VAAIQGRAAGESVSLDPERRANPEAPPTTHKAAIAAKGPAVGLLLRSLLSARLCDNLKDFYTLWPKGLSRFRTKWCRKNTPFFS
jgi:hypothetical protein